MSDISENTIPPNYQESMMYWHERWDAERARADAAEAKLAAVKDMPIVEERGSQTAEELLRNEGWNDAVFEMRTALDEAVRKATSCDD